MFRAKGWVRVCLGTGYWAESLGLRVARAKGYGSGLGKGLGLKVGERLVGLEGLGLSAGASFMLHWREARNLIKKTSKASKPKHQ